VLFCVIVPHKGLRWSWQVEPEIAPLGDDLNETKRCHFGDIHGTSFSFRDFEVARAAKMNQTVDQMEKISIRRNLLQTMIHQVGCIFGEMAASARVARA
jgi:phage head maturation protease